MAEPHSPGHVEASSSNISEVWINLKALRTQSMSPVVNLHKKIVHSQCRAVVLAQDCDHQESQATMYLNKKTFPFSTTVENA